MKTGMILGALVLVMAVGASASMARQTPDEQLDDTTTFPDPISFFVNGWQVECSRADWLSVHPSGEHIVVLMVNGDDVTFYGVPIGAWPLIYHRAYQCHTTAGR